MNMKFFLAAFCLLAATAPVLARVPAASDPHLAALAGRTCHFNYRDGFRWRLHFANRHGAIDVHPRQAFQRIRHDLGWLPLARASSTAYAFTTPWDVRVLMTPQASPSGLVVQRFFPNHSRDYPVTFACAR